MSGHLTEATVTCREVSDSRPSAGKRLTVVGPILSHAGPCLAGSPQTVSATRTHRPVLSQPHSRLLSVLNARGTRTQSHSLWTAHTCLHPGCGPFLALSCLLPAPCPAPSPLLWRLISPSLQQGRAFQEGTYLKRKLMWLMVQI